MVKAKLFHMDNPCSILVPYGFLITSYGFLMWSYRPLTTHSMALGFLSTTGLTQGILNTAGPE